MLFNRKKNAPVHSGMKTAGDSTVENCNIFSRTETGDTILCDYKHLDSLANMKAEIDSFLARFSNEPGVIDEGNCNMLDTMISDRLKEDLNYIENQYKKRQIQLVNMCAIAEANLKRKWEEYEDIRAKIAETDEHIKKLKETFYKKTYNF